MKTSGGSAAPKRRVGLILLGSAWAVLLASCSAPSSDAPRTAAGAATEGTAMSNTAPASSSPVPEAHATATVGEPGGGGVLVLDLLAGVPVRPETPQGYDRGLFPVWSDLDGDGCDTREEVLIRDSRGTAQVDPYGCRVVAGDWYSPYDGVWVSDPSELDIDHVVALKEAWDSGADAWDAATRERFANDLDDPRSLIAVTASSNRSKGDADPSNWMPPNRGDWCRYVSAWVVVKWRWGLAMDPSEYGRVRNLLTGECEGATAEDGIPAAPTTAATTTTAAAATTTASTAAPSGGSQTVVISVVVYDAAGRDVEYGDSEYVELANTGGAAVDVSGWVLADEAGNRIVIGSGYSIPPGGSLRVYTGPGDDTPTRFFAGRGQAVWNNEGDTVSLYDTSGNLVDRYSY